MRTGLVAGCRSSSPASGRRPATPTAAADPSGKRRGIRADLGCSLLNRRKVLAALSLVAGLGIRAARALGAQVAARSRGRTDRGCVMSRSGKGMERAAAGTDATDGPRVPASREVPPLAEVTTKHSPATMKIGRILTRMGWTAFFIQFGFLAYYAYRGYQEAGLSLPLVLIVLAGWSTWAVILIGMNFSGRGGADLSVFRGPGVLLIIAQIAASIFVAAYAHWIEHGTTLAYTFVPKTCYHLLQGLIASDWFTIPASIPIWIIWTLIVLVFATGVNKAISAIFGSDSDLAEWSRDTFGGISIKHDTFGDISIKEPFGDISIKGDSGSDL